jgi:hypothetical protein
MRSSPCSPARPKYARAGNTGALMAISRFVLKTLEGIDRPAIASSLPNLKGGVTTMLDLGANVDCTAEHLFEFAILGAALSSAKRKPSMATGFGLTLLISFTYYAVLRIGQALGLSGVIDPFLGAWMGNVIFVAIGGMLLYRANQ